MTDKGTREDDEARGEVLPLGGPRSEGGPVTREPDVHDRPAAAARADAFSEVSDAEMTTEAMPDGAGGPSCSSASDQTGEPPVVPSQWSELKADGEAEGGDSREADASGAWRGAIADALAEPDGSLQKQLDADRSTQTQPSQAQTSEPEPVAAAPDAKAAASETAPADNAPAAGAAAFTDAAQDLFRPPAFDRGEETHLITLGRRLDPSLRIPRPVAPVIEPRQVPETQPASLPWWKSWISRDRLWNVARYGLYAVGGYLALVVVLIVLFRFVNPPGSMLMLTQLLSGTSIDRTWVPLGSISSNLVRAVVVSEDGRFCEHSGIDTEAIREAIERSSRGVPRGASTISMQVTKNLFLWNAKSYVRKVVEIPLTLVMELIWPKWRILEVYLNIAEWGPGTFGAEAAARRHFNTSAAQLSAREAALLAAVLPNPILRDAGSPNAQTSAKARVVQSRVKAYGAVATCVTSVAAKARAAAPAIVAPRASTPRKAPSVAKKPVQRKKQPTDDWAPTLNFGPSD